MFLIKVLKAIWDAVNPVTNAQAIIEAFRSVFQHRALAVEMTRRDLGGQYAGQAFGQFWIFGHPLLLFTIYVVIFAVVLQVRIQASVDLPRDYTTYIMAGLVPWFSILQTLTRSPMALVGQASLVKQVVFPIEVLPVSAVIASLVPLSVGLILVVGRGAIFLDDVPVTLVLLPVLIAIQLCFLLGVAFLLAAITPFFRDIKDVIVVLTVAGVYVLPAFYLPEWVPATLRPILYANPFSYFIWAYQDVLYFGSIEHPFAWAVIVALSVISLCLGYRVFRHLKPYIANVL